MILVLLVLVLLVLPVLLLLLRRRLFHHTHGILQVAQRVEAVGFERQGASQLLDGGGRIAGGQGVGARVVERLGVQLRIVGQGGHAGVLAGRVLVPAEARHGRPHGQGQTGIVRRQGAGLEEVAQGGLVVAGQVVVETPFGGGRAVGPQDVRLRARRRRGQAQQRDQGGPQGWTRPHQRPGPETGESQAEGPDETFLIAADVAAVQLALPEPRDERPHGFDVQPGRADAEHHALAVLGQPLQRGHVETAHDHLTLLVLQIAGAGRIGVRTVGREGDQAAGLLAHAHRNHRHAALAAEGRGLLPAPLQVLAVGHQQDGPAGGRVARVGAALEQAEGDGQGRAEGRALGGDHVRIGHAQEELRGAEVEGQGALDEGLPREEHQSHPAAVEVLEQGAQLGAGAGQTAGHHVLGAHGVGDVQGDHHVGAALLHHHLVGAPLGSGQGHHQPDQAGQGEEPSPGAGRRRQVLHVLAGAGSQQRAQATARDAVAPAQPEPQDRRQGQQVEPVSGGESQDVSSRGAARPGRPSS